MSGLVRGMSGAAGWSRAYTVTSGLLALVCVVNVASRWHDTRAGVPLWRPLLGEASSITAVLAFSWIVFAARDQVMRYRLHASRALLLHAAAACAFSALHCLGMWTTRRLVLTAFGLPYGWGISPGQVFYEFRKDLVTYTVISLIYQGLRAPAAIVAEPATQSPVSQTYDIRDGARLWRVRVHEMLAVRSAGNYVEYWLDDGRRIMARGTLSGVGAALAPSGFLRVHRSWIVNAARVCGVSPEASGDYTLAVDGGTTVPLSRRFPEALARVRGEEKGWRECATPPKTPRRP